MTFRERFFGLPNSIGSYYAPVTLGSPALLNNIDFSIFKKNQQEKDILKSIKLDHKESLRKAYGNNIGKHLNIPENEIIFNKQNWKN